MTSYVYTYKCTLTVFAASTLTLLDANVVLRYLLDDIPEQSQEVARIMESGVVFIPHEVVAAVYIAKSTRRHLLTPLVDRLQPDGYSKTRCGARLTRAR